MSDEHHNEASDAWWEAVYIDDSAPWDIARPQATWSRLAAEAEIESPVLDSGCGTGEHGLLLASRGHEVVGIDLSENAIARAREKAEERGIQVDFRVGDVLHLDRLGREFATVIDSGVFHVFDDDDRARYVRSLASVLRDGGVLHLLAFSEHTPGTQGPRRVTQAELHAAFADGWEVDRIEAAMFEVRPDWAPIPARAWLAHIVRWLTGGLPTTPPFRCSPARRGPPRARSGPRLAPCRTCP